MKNKNRIFAGIDPDVTKNGLCLFSKNPFDEQQSSHNNGYFAVFNIPFPELIEKLRGIKNVHVIVEAGWINKSNWHINPYKGAAYNATIGKNTGRNEETGRKIIEMLEYYKISYETFTPNKSTPKYSPKIAKSISGLKFAKSHGEKMDALRCVTKYL